METAGGVEGGAGRRARLLDRERSVLHPVGDDPRELPDELIDVGGDHLPRLAGELNVGREQLGVVPGPVALGRHQELEPSVQTLRRRARLVGDHRQRFGDAVQPALGDGVAQRRLAGEVAVDAPVADPELAGDVDDRRLRGP